MNSFTTKRHSKLRHVSTAQELNILLKQFDMVISLHTYSHVIPTVIVCLFWPWIYVEFQGSSRTCSTFGGVLLSKRPFSGTKQNVPMIFLLYVYISGVALPVAVTKRIYCAPGAWNQHHLWQYFQTAPIPTTFIDLKSLIFEERLILVWCLLLCREPWFILSGTGGILLRVSEA